MGNRAPRREDLQRRSPDKPEGLQIKGLSAGFVRVNANLAPGTVVELKDSKRAIQVVIETMSVPIVPRARP